MLECAAQADASLVDEYVPVPQAVQYASAVIVPAVNPYPEPQKWVVTILQGISSMVTVL
jgi:hypothetical protein